MDNQKKEWIEKFDKEELEKIIERYEKMISESKPLGPYAKRLCEMLGWNPKK